MTYGLGLRSQQKTTVLWEDWVSRVKVKKGQCRIMSVGIYRLPFLCLLTLLSRAAPEAASETAVTWHSINQMTKITLPACLAQCCYCMNTVVLELDSTQAVCHGWSAGGLVTDTERHYNRDINSCPNGKTKSRTNKSERDKFCFKTKKLPIHSGF